MTTEQPLCVRIRAATLNAALPISAWPMLVQEQVLNG